MITDNLGNPLQAGQLVIMIGDRGDQMYCFVKEVDQGGQPELLGTSLTTKAPIKPGTIVLVPSEMTIQVTPNKRIPFLTVVRDPKCPAPDAQSTTKPAATAATNMTNTSLQADAKSAGPNLKPASDG